MSPTSQVGTVEQTMRIESDLYRNPSDRRGVGGRFFLPRFTHPQILLLIRITTDTTPRKKNTLPPRQEPRCSLDSPLLMNSTNTNGRAAGLITEFQLSRRPFNSLLRSILNPLKILWSNCASRCMRLASRLLTTSRPSSSLNPVNSLLSLGSATDSLPELLDPTSCSNSLRCPQARGRRTMLAESLMSSFQSAIRRLRSITPRRKSLKLPESSSAQVIVSICTDTCSPRRLPPTVTSISSSYEAWTNSSGAPWTPKEVSPGRIQETLKEEQTEICIGTIWKVDSKTGEITAQDYFDFPKMVVKKGSNHVANKPQ